MNYDSIQQIQDSIPQIFSSQGRVYIHDADGHVTHIGYSMFTFKDDDMDDFVNEILDPRNR